MADGDSLFETNRGQPGVGVLTVDQMQQRAAAASQQANTGQGFFSSDPYNNYRVYMGTGPMTSVGPSLAPYAPGVIPLAAQTGYQSYSEAVLAPTQWNDTQLREFVNKGIINKIPGFEVGMGMPQIQSAWQNMVQASIMFNDGLKEGQKPWSPMDVMDTWSNSKGKFGTQRQGDWVFDVATGERIQYVGPKSRTTTQKRVDLTSAADVKALAGQMLAELLGRAPTAKELAQFRSSINAEEEATPTITTVTETLTPDLATGQVTATDQSSTTSGGVSDAARAALISSPVTETKEYGKYQAATTYWDAMMQMIGGS